MNRLNGKIYGGKLTGHVICDGEEYLHAGHVNPGYVPQDDIMHNDLTVRQVFL